MSNGIPFSPILYQPPMTEGEILEADLEQSLTDFDDIIAGNIDVINNIFFTAGNTNFTTPSAWL